MNSFDKDKVQWWAVVSRFMNHRVNLKTGISSPAARTTATEDVTRLCSMELAGETWVCRRMEDEMAGHLQTDLTAQFKYTKRTNSGIFKKNIIIIIIINHTSHFKTVELLLKRLRVSLTKHFLVTLLPKSS